MNSVPISDEVRSSIIDAEHLRLLSLGHYIVGGLEILFSSIFIFHFVMFFFVASDPQFFPPPETGAARATAGNVPSHGRSDRTAILAGWTFGALTIYVGRSIKRAHKSHPQCRGRLHQSSVHPPGHHTWRGIAHGSDSTLGEERI